MRFIWKRILINSPLFQVDAFGEDVTFDLGAEHKVKLEGRLRLLEEGNLRRLSGTGKVKAKFEKYHAQSQVQTYETAHDNTLPVSGQKRKLIEEVDEETATTPKQKSKKSKQEAPEEGADEAVAGPSSEKKKKKKDKGEPVEAEEVAETPKSEKKKKKKAKESAADETMELDESAMVEEPVSEKKKKKKKAKE